MMTEEHRWDCPRCDGSAFMDETRELCPCRCHHYNHDDAGIDKAACVRCENDTHWARETDNGREE